MLKAARVSITVLSMTLACGVAHAQVLDAPTQPGLQPGQIAPAGQISFTESGVDFGRIGDQQQVSHTFSFTNVGKGDLVIQDARGSCGCTVPQLAKRTYAPGESGTLQVVFNPANRRGQQSQTVTVRTNDPMQPITRLSVQAVVQPRTLVMPQSLSFGFVPKGAGNEMDVTVMSLEESFDVTKAFVELTPLPQNMEHMKPDWKPEDVFKVRIGERGTQQQDGKTYTQRLVHVKVADDAPIGLLRNVRLVVEHNDPSTTRFELPILATQLGDVTFTPPRLSFGRVAPNTPVNKQVIIRSASNTPFEITKVEHLTTSGQNIEHIVEPIEGANNAAYRLTLKSDGIATQGALRGQLRFHTNVEDEEIITYNYVGAVMPERAANLVPTQQMTPAER